MRAKAQGSRSSIAARCRRLRRASGIPASQLPRALAVDGAWETITVSGRAGLEVIAGDRSEDEANGSLWCRHPPDPVHGLADALGPKAQRRIGAVVARVRFRGVCIVHLCGTEFSASPVRDDLRSGIRLLRRLAASPGGLLFGDGTDPAKSVPTEPDD